MVHDEDRYELYRAPVDPRYYFRRLMWASLLSGGHATYGGLKTYEPFDGKLQGVQGYFDARERGLLAGGADDFVHIHTFFRDSGLTLVGYQPDDACVGNDPLRVKCIRNGSNYIVYHANPWLLNASYGISALAPLQKPAWTRPALMLHGNGWIM